VVWPAELRVVHIDPVGQAAEWCRGRAGDMAMARARARARDMAMARARAGDMAMARARGRAMARSSGGGRGRVRARGRTRAMASRPAPLLPGRLGLLAFLPVLALLRRPRRPGPDTVLRPAPRSTFPGLPCRATPYCLAATLAAALAATPFAAAITTTAFASTTLAAASGFAAASTAARAVCRCCCDGCCGVDSQDLLAALRKAPDSSVGRRGPPLVLFGLERQRAQQGELPARWVDEEHLGTKHAGVGGFRIRDEGGRGY